MDRKGLKKTGKKNLNTHYWICVVACLLASLFGIEFVGSTDIVKAFTSDSSQTDITSVSPFVANTYSLIDNFMGEDKEKIKESATKLMDDEKNKDVTYGGLELGRKDGVLAHVVNMVSSGSMILTVLVAIKNVAESSYLLAAILVVLSLLLIILIWSIIFNTFSAAYRRIFMESRVYEKMPFHRFLFIYKDRKLFKVALTVGLKEVFQFLWNLTIVGGIIKRYSYALVPYIVAENKDILPLKAITLSRKMMKGHKWELFVLDISFIGWYLLDFFTLGLLGIFFLNPYKESVVCEYYVNRREKCKSENLENIDLLNDTYLYEKASNETIRNSYKDIIELMDTPEPVIHKRNKFLTFIANVFGVIPTYNQTEKEYTEFTERKIKIVNFKDVINGYTYPTRLYPLGEKVRKTKFEHLHYMRRYSVTSLIMMFFIFCFMGWFWEVIFHFIEKGEFVNRGVMHGPWLPIYGSGCVMILVLLNKLRKNPIIEFISAVVLCGIVEYITSVFLEYQYGKLWWDYSGYFLNINGRVCAEGLLVFGIGGIIVVYIVAPLLDNLLRKIPLKISITICVVLVLAFTADRIYSSKVPNSGKGVTDYSREIKLKPKSTKTSYNPTCTVTDLDSYIIGKSAKL